MAPAVGLGDFPREGAGRGHRESLSGSLVETSREGGPSVWSIICWRDRGTFERSLEICGEGAAGLSD